MEQLGKYGKHRQRRSRGVPLDGKRLGAYRVPAPWRKPAPGEPQPESRKPK